MASLPLSLAGADSTQIGKTKGIATMLIVLVIVVLVIIIAAKGIRGISALFEGLGLKDSKEEKQNQNAIATGVDKEQKKGVLSAWAPSFYKNAPGGSMLLTSARANDLAEKLWSSVGYVYDSPAIGAGVIKQLKTKSQVSFLMDTFFKKYNVDGLQWLQNKYDTKEQKEYLADMLSYVKSLPDYNA